MFKPSPELATMIRAAKKAGQLLVERQSTNLRRIKKGNNDFATEADIDAQEVIRATLVAAFPGIPIVGEEDKRPKITSSTFFTADPLDNTKPYAAGFPQGWGTIIGFVRDYQVQAGVIYLPKEKELWVAEKGKGCWRNGQPWRLQYTTSLKQSVIDIELGPWLDRHCLTTVVGPLATASGMIKSCESVVGMGTLRSHCGLWIFVRGRRKKGGGIWDFTAPTILHEEAGGFSGSVRGGPLLFDHIDMNGVVYAANKKILREALPLMRRW